MQASRGVKQPEVANRAFRVGVARHSSRGHCVDDAPPLSPPLRLVPYPRFPRPLDSPADSPYNRTHVLSAPTRTLTTCATSPMPAGGSGFPAREKRETKPLPPPPGAASAAPLPTEPPGRLPDACAERTRSSPLLWLRTPNSKGRAHTPLSADRARPGMGSVHKKCVSAERTEARVPRVGRGFEPLGNPRQPRGLRRVRDLLRAFLWLCVGRSEPLGRRRHGSSDRVKCLSGLAPSRGGPVAVGHYTPAYCSSAPLSASSSRASSCRHTRLSGWASTIGGS